MAERFQSHTIISAEEALRIEIMVNQALVDILIAKEIVTEGELIAAVRKIKRQQENIFNEPNISDTETKTAPAMKM
jgi:hypothetical protein